MEQLWSARISAAIGAEPGYQVRRRPCPASLERSKRRASPEPAAPEPIAVAPIITTVAPPPEPAKVEAKPEPVKAEVKPAAPEPAKVETKPLAPVAATAATAAAASATTTASTDCPRVSRRSGRRASLQDASRRSPGQAWTPALLSAKLAACGG